MARIAWNLKPARWEKLHPSPWYHRPRVDFLAPIQVRAGDLIEITGVARLPKPLLGSVDDLQIIDSLGGPDMALRIHHAPSWQPFRVIRAATSDAQLTVTIALFGLGKAQIDDLAIRIVKKQ